MAFYRLKNSNRYAVNVFTLLCYCAAYEASIVRMIEELTSASQLEL